MTGARLGTIAARVACPLLPEIAGRIGDEVYLTIDDGPSRTSGPIISVLDELGVPATWFLVGASAARHPGLVREVLGAGHGIANHSFAHLDAWLTPWQRVEADLNRGLEVIEQVSGSACTMTRPPYGRIRPATLRWSRARGQRLVLWDVMAPDFRSPVDPGAAGRAVTRFVRPGSIIVTHDHDRPEQVEVIRNVIRRLRDGGLRFGLLSADPTERDRSA